MRTVAVTSATFLFILMMSDGVSARQIPYELKTNHDVYGNRLSGVRLAASEPVALPVKELEGAPGAPIDLELSLPAEDLKFVMFQSIPEGIKFSRGFLTNKNWFVAINDLSETTLVSTQDSTDPVVMEVFYFRDSKQQPIARGLIIVNFTKPERADREPTSKSQDQLIDSKGTLSSENELDLPSSIPAVSPKQEAADLQQAKVFLRNGDISSARRILEFLASQGSAKGARALAETYDPAYLRDVTTAGLRPDVDRARKWYKRAAELGDNEAVSLLSALDGR